MINVARLVKFYGKILALNQVTIRFEDEKVTAIMGENGAGKTTLLKICAGILSFDSGEVQVDEFSLTQNSLAARERIGYLPEMPMMYERLTGKEFLFYIASLRRIPQAEERITRLSSLLGIDRFLDYEIGTYSKGMKQKLSIITAIMHEPGNLLLDEPVWGLDPLTSRALKSFIMERKGTTILATHAPGFVEEVADIVYIMMQGRIIASGDVDAMMTKYGSIEEAYFHAKDG
ncbi:MAG: ABC transporter ATP-binding protein [Methanobacteriota archaeon]